MAKTTIAAGPPRSILAFLRESRSTGISDQGSVEGTNTRKGGVRRLVALLVMLGMILGGVFGLVSAANAEDDAMKYSFYRMASGTTALFSTIQEPGSDKTFGPEWQQVMQDPGSAGSLLGYADPNFSDVGGWLASKLSGSSDAIGYDTLVVKDENGLRASSNQQGMLDYAYFGAALKGMGLDGTSTGLSLGFMNVISGGVVMLLYILAGAIDFLFLGVLSVLKLLNPFKLFYSGIAAISPEFAEGMVGGTPSQGSLSPFFAGLSSWIGGWYQALNTLSWSIMVPLFLGVFLFGLVMFKKMNRGGAIKKLVIRVAFIGLGLPLIGMMYTGMIGQMAESAESGNSGSTRVVMSTYVDFENWALNNRLAVPDGTHIGWDANGSQPTPLALMNVRNTALAINEQTHRIGLLPVTSSGSFDASWSAEAMEAGRSERGSSHSYFATTDVLLRFISNAQVSSAAFETAAKGQLSASSFYADNKDTVKYWFESITKNDANKINDLAGAAGTDTISPTLNPVISVTPGMGLRGDGPATQRTYSSNINGCSVTGTSITTNGVPRSCNLSPLAMYNYLNTDFGSTSMTMYSSSNVMSEATRSIHNSVNQVGTGTMSFLYWFNAVVLLGSFVLIGLGYVFAIVFANIRRTFQIMTAVPFATLGAMAAIAKVLVYSFALILEVIVTIFLYKIVQEVLLAIPQIIEMPFALALNNGAGGDAAGFITFLTTGPAFGMVVTLFSIIGVTLFTIVALRSRKAITKAMEEVITKLVEKFTDTTVGTPGGGNMAPALAGGLAAGAGAAAANRMMSGGNGAKGAAAAGGGENGPDGVKTEGGTVEGGSQRGGEAGGMAALSAGGSGPDGGGGDGTVDGEIGVGDGSLEVEGNAGGEQLALESGSGGVDGADEAAEGRRVEAEGLSRDVEAADSAGGVQAADGGARGPQVDSGDVSDTVSNSMDQSAEGFKEADKQRLGGVKEGAEATGHAAVAVGRGFAGDGAGAAESGGKALEHGGAAAASGYRAKQAEENATRSSLDAPSNKNAKRAARAEQVSNVGRGVSQTAGQVSATGGATSKAGAASSGAKAPAAAKTVQAKPQGQAPQNTSVTNVDRSKTVTNKSKKKVITPKSGGSSSSRKGGGSGQSKGAKPQSGK